MGNIESLVSRLKDEWTVPRPATHHGTRVPVPLRCSFASPAREGDLALVAAQFITPASVLEFWQISDGARLYEDEQYGQWGLLLFSATDALAKTAEFAAQRPRDFKQGDLVLGTFLGDSDLLLVRCDPSLNSFGSVVIALPVDERADWEHAASNLEDFLHFYANTHGEKFWRAHPS